MPYERDGITAQLKEINEFASVLEVAIPARNNGVIALAVHTITGELRELVDWFPGVKDTTVEGGIAERLAARNILKELVLTMRRIGLAAATDRFDEVAREYQSYRVAFAEVPFLLKTAAPWSLFNPAVHQAHFAEMRRLHCRAGWSRPGSDRCHRWKAAEE